MVCFSFALQAKQFKSHIAFFTLCIIYMISTQPFAIRQSIYTDTALPILLPNCLFAKSAALLADTHIEYNVFSIIVNPRQAKKTFFKCQKQGQISNLSKISEFMDAHVQCCSETWITFCVVSWETLGCECYQSAFKALRVQGFGMQVS